MKKRMFSILLALAMVMGLLAGCGGNNATSEPAASTPESAAASEKEPAAEEPAAPVSEEEASMEEASAEEAVSDRPEIVYPLVEETTTLTYWQAWPPFLNEISAPQDAAMYDVLEQATGIHLEITAVSTENDATDFMLMCATGDMTDMIQKGASHYTGGGTKAIEDDILIDMLPYLEEYSNHYYGLMESDPTFYRNVVNDEGQVPALIGIYKDPYYTDQGYWIRKDILDSVGKEVPTTLSELEDVLAAFKDNGLTDPIVVLSEGQCDLLARALGMGDSLVDGKIVSTTLTDEGKEFYLQMNDWYNKGYINVDFVTYNTSDTKPPQDIVLNDMAGIFNEDVASVAGYTNMATNPDFDLQPLAQIRKTPDQKLNNGFIGVYAADKYSLSISTNCESPELAIQYMDYLFSDEGFVAANYGVEGETYTVDADGNYQFTDLILNNEQGFDWQLCQSLYINPGFPSLNDLHAQELTYSDAQKAAVPTWTGAYDSSDETMPNENFLSYTTEESQRKAELETDLETYQQTMTLKFITGQADIEAEWDTYVEQCMSMGFEEIQEIKQAAVDRYVSK